MLAKFSNYFLFLAVAFVMLFNPFAVKAQSNSVSGVIWQTDEVVLPPSITNDTDGSVTAARRYYYFDTQGKVTELVVFSKSGGTETKLDGDLIVNGAGDDKYENRLRYKTVPTSPDTTSLKSIGTYTINGKSLTFEIPKYYTVNATIYNDRIEGTMTGKNGSKSKWIITKRPPQKGETGNSVSRNVQEDKFSVPTDSPIIGTWKYVVYHDKGLETYENGRKKVVPLIFRTSTFIYSQNGVVESIHEMFGTSPVRIKGNWKYIPKNASSGILEEYLGSELIERGDVRFLSRSQIEYTITFSSNSDVIGKQYVWNRQ